MNTVCPSSGYLDTYTTLVEKRVPPVTENREVCCIHLIYVTVAAQSSLYV